MGVVVVELGTGQEERGHTRQVKLCVVFRRDEVQQDIGETGLAFGL
jgi:hypothetical protein